MGGRCKETKALIVFKCMFLKGNIRVNVYMWSPLMMLLKKRW